MCFLIIGVRYASLRSGETLPVVRELFMMAVRGGNSCGKHLRNRSAGMGSRADDLTRDFLIKSATSLSVRGLNSENVEDAAPGKLYHVAAHQAGLS